MTFYSSCFINDKLFELKGILTHLVSAKTTVGFSHTALNSSLYIILYWAAPDCGDDGSTPHCSHPNFLAVCPMFQLTSKCHPTASQAVPQEGSPYSSSRPPLGGLFWHPSLPLPLLLLPGPMDNAKIHVLGAII